MSEGLPPVELRNLFRRWSARLQYFTEQLEVAETSQKSLRRKHSRVAGKYNSRSNRIDWDDRAQAVEVIRIAQRVDRISRILDQNQQNIDRLRVQFEEARRMKNKIEDNLYC